MIQKIYIVENKKSGTRFAIIQPHKEIEYHDADRDNEFILGGNLSEDEKLVECLDVKDGGSWVR